MTLTLLHGVCDDASICIISLQRIVKFVTGYGPNGYAFWFFLPLLFGVLDKKPLKPLSFYGSLSLSFSLYSCFKVLFGTSLFYIGYCTGNHIKFDQGHFQNGQVVLLTTTDAAAYELSLPYRLTSVLESLVYAGVLLYEAKMLWTGWKCTEVLLFDCSKATITLTWFLDFYSFGWQISPATSKNCF